jgi:hypothetical protein
VFNNFARNICSGFLDYIFMLGMGKAPASAETIFLSMQV